MAEKFKFGVSLGEHTPDDQSCRGCTWDRPTVCKCDGLVHIEYMDHPTEPFVYFCDRCSDNAGRRKPAQYDYEI